MLKQFAEIGWESKSSNRMQKQDRDGRFKISSSVFFIMPLRHLLYMEMCNLDDNIIKKHPIGMATLNNWVQLNNEQTNDLNNQYRVLIK